MQSSYAVVHILESHIGSIPDNRSTEEAAKYISLARKSKNNWKRFYSSDAFHHILVLKMLDENVSVIFYVTCLEQTLRDITS